MEGDRIPLGTLREGQFSSSSDDAFVDGELKDEATTTEPLDEDNQLKTTSVSSYNAVPLIR